MPAYAAWLERELDRRPPRRRSIPGRHPERTIVVCEYEPDMDRVARLIGGLPAVVVLPHPPACPRSGCRYAEYEPGTNPTAWGESVPRLVHEGCDTVAFLIPRDRVYGRTLLQLRRLGVRRCIFLDADRPTVAGPLVAAARRRMEGLVRRALGTDLGERMTIEQCRAVLAHARPPRAPRDPTSLRIVHYVGTLDSGGAERQLCQLAAGQKQAAHRVEVRTTYPLAGRLAHYRPILHAASVPSRQAGAVTGDAIDTRWRQAGLEPSVLSTLPRRMRRFVADLLGELLADPVDVLHAWLDEANVVALIAGRLAGVPAVVLSARNVSPRHCPRLLQPWMRPWYRLVKGMNGVALVANSEAGARDYEAWIGMPAHAIGVIRNAVHPVPPPDPALVGRVREELGLGRSNPVVAGIFRLDPEKRPLRFLEIAEAVRARVPDLKVVLTGHGTLDDTVRAAVARRGLDTFITVTGRRHDVPVILAAADVLLLVSEIEGTPNVALEAQTLGCVPVLTDAGGARETIDPQRTGLLFGREDTDGIVEGVVGLLTDEARRTQLAAAGSDFVAERFGPDRALEETAVLYRRLLGGSP